MEGNLYKLCSLVVHYGSHSFGHYVAFRRRPSSSLNSFTPLPLPSSPPENVDFLPSAEPTPRNPSPEWYRISDETVEPSRLVDVLRANPFLMFYEKVESGNQRASEETGNKIIARTVESWMAGKWKGKE